MKGHPTEIQLASFAGGECGGLSRWMLNRHVRQCPECSADVAEFRAVRSELAEMPVPDINWNTLAAEMRANIHLGLEAGACVRRPVIASPTWNPRLAVAFGSLVMLLGAGILMKTSSAPEVVRSASPTLESTGSGVEFHSGQSTLTILNHHGAIADQTVGAQGAIGARYIDGDTGAVTINNVYLE